MYTKDGFHKALEQKLGDDAYLLLAAGGHKKLAELLESASLGASGNSTTLSVTVGGTTKSNSITVPYANKASTWETGRTLTIGSTGKSIDGSKNVTWTLDEIGVYSKTAADDRYVNVTGDTMSGQLYINLDQDVGLNQNGSLVIGNKAGENLAFDGNEIMARNNSSAATLYLQAEGGNLYSSAGTNYFSGNVGIGTSSPSQKLHVSGGIIQINANSRYLQLGPQNSSWAHLQSDVNFYFNRSIHVDGDIYLYGTSVRMQKSNGYVYSSGFYHNSYGSATYLLRSDGGAAAFNWSGQSGQPTWVWGGNSQHTYYVYNPSNFSVNYANSAGNADTVDSMHASQFLQRLPWWTSGNGNNINNIANGTTFAYTNHNAPTNGVFVAFSGTHDSYQLQLQGQYNGENLYFRNKNGDNGTWNTWRYVIHSGNIGSQSVNYATSAGYLRDRSNSTATYANYGAAGLGLGSITWLTCWNGYELRAISKGELGGLTNVYQHTGNNVDYPLVWSNQNNTSTVQSNQLHKSYADLVYNPANKEIKTWSFAPQGENTNRGIHFPGGAWINSIGTSIIFRNATIRFGGSGWDWNTWAGLSFDGNTTINIGMPNNSHWTANSNKTAGTIRTVSSKIEIFPDGNSNYGEGLRIHTASNGWTTLMLAGSDNTGFNGTSANSWSLHTNGGNFYLNKNGSNNQQAARLWGHSNGYTFGSTSRSNANVTVTSWLEVTGAASATMSYSTTNPRITFSENGSQAVGIVYTDYDSYRASKGLKVMDVDNSDTGNVWLEVQGYTYSTGFVKNGSSDTYVLLGGGGHQDKRRWTFTYNSANYNGSSSLTLNQMAADGNSNSHVAMIYAGTDNPVSSSGNWVHVWSQTWSMGVTSSWVSQIALGVQQGTGMWYRTTSGNVVGRAWTRVLDSSNYTSYVNNYYWANIKISTSSSTSTQPTFNTCYTSNWFRSTGATGWYNESYGGGIYMNDSSWVRTYNSKGMVATCFYASNWASATYLLRSDGGAASFNWSGQSGQPTWVWGGNSQHTYYVYNPSNFSVNYANSAGYATYLPTKYDGGDKSNPQQYFNENIGVRVAMTRYASIGGSTTWADTLWINGYSGSDVPNMCALTFKRDGTPRFFVHSQSNRSTSYGTYYEVITGYNIGSQSVSYASSAGSIAWGNVTGKPGATGSATKPVYWTGSGFTACNYSLSATVNSGTASRIAYYSGANAISSGSIVTDGGYLGSVSYLSVNTSHQTGYRLYVNGTSYLNGSTMINNSLQIGSGSLSNITNTSSSINALKIKPVRFTTANVNLSSFTTAVPGIICCNYTGGNITLTLPTGSATLEGSIVFVHVTQHTNNNFYYKVNGQNFFDASGNITSQGSAGGGWSRLSCFFICIYDAYRGAYMWRFYQCTDSS